jgi:hypothetical protein
METKTHVFHIPGYANIKALQNRVSIFLGVSGYISNVFTRKHTLYKDLLTYLLLT